MGKRVHPLNFASNQEHIKNILNLYFEDESLLCTVASINCISINRALQVKCCIVEVKRAVEKLPVYYHEVDSCNSSTW